MILKCMQIMSPLLVESVMKNIISALILLVTFPAFSAGSTVKISSYEEGKWVAEWVHQDDVAHTTRLFAALKGKPNNCVEDFQTCAEASIERSGYVYSDCFKIANDAQDICASASIIKSGYVYSDCFKLMSGGKCALASIERSGYVYSDCTNIKTYRQDRCSAASIKRSGYVYSDCLKI